MCTLIALHRCTPDAHLWIAANRDEFLARPAEGPALRIWKDTHIVSPLDREAGGTWWGLSEHGVFAALTNRPTPAPDPGRRSRGLLVLDALTARSAKEAEAMLCALPDGSYNPFNLFVADAERAFTLVFEGSGALWPMAAGVHVVGNADPDTEDVEKVRRTLERARGLEHDDPEALATGLAALCATHDDRDDPIASPCVHAGSYGTRSSALLRLGSDREILRHADGPPCTTLYEDFSPLLETLGQRSLREIPKPTRKAS